MEEVGKNIINAVHVLLGTYENIKKLVDALEEFAHKNGFKPIKEQKKYLTWTNPNHAYGWLYRFIIKCYEISDEPNTLYTVEISLDTFNGDEPAIILGKHIFEQVIRTQDFNSINAAAYLTHRHHQFEFYKITPIELDKFDNTVYTSEPRKIENKNYQGHDNFKKAYFKKVKLVGFKKSDIDGKIFKALKEISGDV